MKYNYPYLKDSTFLLNEVFQDHNIEQTVRFTVLTFEEKPIKNISGRITGGSVDMAGSSAIRRTMKLTTFIEEKDSSYMEIGGLFSLNKKIKVEIGLKNTTDKFKDYPILWFPMGIYVIMELSSSHGVGGTTIDLTLKDKMVFLNGECGGMFPAAETLHEYDEIDFQTGQYYTDKPTIVQIIKEVVHHYGGEALEKIIVSDIDEKVKQVMRWTPKDKTKQLRFWYDQNTEVYNFEEVNEKYKKSKGDIDVFQDGDDVGFIYSKFYYPGSEGLIAQAGESVCTILDKIKNILGNFEYFYDLNGNFVFQEIKNYLNKNKASTDLRKYFGSEITSKDFYLSSKRRGEAKYDLNGNRTVISFNNYPKYSQIKNDFIVWGVREDETGKKNIRYHLAIDKKPEVKETDSYPFYTYEEDGVIKNQLPIVYTAGSDLPSIGQEGRLYMVQGFGIESLFLWDPDNTTTYKVSLGGKGKSIEDDSESESLGDETYDGYSSVAGCLLEGDDEEELSMTVKRSSISKEAVRSLAIWRWDPITESSVGDLPIAPGVLPIKVPTSEGGRSAKKWKVEQKLVYQEKNKKKIPYDLVKATVVLTNGKEDIRYITVPYRWNEEKGEYIRSIGQLTENTEGKLYVDYKDFSISAYDNSSMDYYVFSNSEPNPNQPFNQLAFVSKDDSIDATNIKKCEIIEVIKTDYLAELDSNNQLQETILIRSHYKYCGTPSMIQIKDWRTKLYLEGSQGSRFGTDSNYYYPELVNEWGKIFELTKKEGSDTYEDSFRQEIQDYPDKLDYFLDIIDGEGTSLAELSVQNIGRRTRVINDDKINCIFEPAIPDFIIINEDDGSAKNEILKDECKNKTQKYVMTNKTIYEQLTVGGTKNSAYNAVRDLLYQHTHYNETCKVQMLPIYFLEPNIRVSLRDDVSGIKGDYMINNISIPLDINGTMTLSCTKALDKI